VTGLVAPEVELPELVVAPELVVPLEAAVPLEVPAPLERVVLLVPALVVVELLFLDRAGSWPVASWTNSTAHSRANATSAVAITRLRIDHARRR
jgi:hypothetical protein